MLKDITIGQYFPGNSIVHRLDARFKIIITLIFIVMIFAANTVWSVAAAVAFLLLSYALTALSPSLMLRSLKPVIPVLIVTAVINVFFFEGEEIFRLWIISVTDEGVKNAVFMLIRVTALIVGSSVLTYTTSPIELTGAIEKLLAPLKVLKFPVHELAMMMTIALRFIPTLIEETEKIISAQKARGADFEHGSLRERAKAVIPVLVPLFISAFRRAEELALAMECRCYRGGEGRTRMKQMKVKPADIVALAVSVIFLAAVIVIDILN
ncbi:MAG: energy-coupling factor transporter transmembrane protein EcfT [Oscillospiraceae bacterium]|nr:energy-coupling factor transporter transmembrane protein EcfT [Oscillospiraceae bacterium]